MPGTGHASPIVWQDRIFVASCLEEDQERMLLCFDRRDGQVALAAASCSRSPLEEKHQLNSFASSTPATDGRLVYVTFLDQHEMVVAAYDFSGKQVWLVRPGPFSSKHGYCSCPVLFEDKVIVNGDHDGDAYLVALDSATGKTVWKIDRENKTRSYSTPIIREIDGRTQMILSGSKCVASYDPHDGSRHWIIDGPTEQFVASMVFNGKLLFLTAGFPELHMMAIRPDGTRQRDRHAHRLANAQGGRLRPLADRRGRLLPGRVRRRRGQLLRSHQRQAAVDGAAGHALIRSSLVSAGGLVYFTSDDGITTVVRPGPKLDVVAENKLGEFCYASPAISDGQILVRGEKHLFCIGDPHTAARGERKR